MMDDYDKDDLKLDTLAGDIRDVMLNHFRNQPASWPQMPADQQRMVVNAFTSAANELVRKTVQLFTDYEFPRAVVTLGEVKIKGEKGLEAKITCPNMELYRSRLGDHVGRQVMILMVDSEEFLNARAPVEIMNDQPDLPIGEPGDFGDPEGEWDKFHADRAASLEDAPEPGPQSIAEAEAAYGQPALDTITIDPETGEVITTGVDEEAVEEANEFAEVDDDPRDPDELEGDEDSTPATDDDWMPDAPPRPARAARG